MGYDINITFEDYEIILSHEGKIDGIVGSCKVDEFMNSLSDSLKLSLKLAKSILIVFEKNEDLPMIQISELIQEINALTMESAYIIYGSKNNNFQDIQTLNFRIIMSGLNSL